MSYYESCLHCLPEGSDSPSRMALAAKRLGYQGVVICNHTGFEGLFRPDAVREVKGIKVAFGAEVVASNPRMLKSRVAKIRCNYPFVGVHGGSEEINKAACENPDVDVLFHPEEAKKTLSIADARAAKTNQVAIGFDLSPLIRLRGSPRSKWLERADRNLILARKFRLSLIITAGAWSHLDLRGPKDLLALAELAGFARSEAEAALRYAGLVLEMNSRRWAGPGVEIL